MAVRTKVAEGGKSPGQTPKAEEKAKAAPAEKKAAANRPVAPSATTIGVG
jgi:hypothetical protein